MIDVGVFKSLIGLFVGAECGVGPLRLGFEIFNLFLDIVHAFLRALFDQSLGLFELQPVVAWFPHRWSNRLWQ